MTEAKKRILFVDDELGVLQGLERMLFEMADTWDMAFVDSAEKALSELSAREFDVIVSDMRMPGMDGAQLLEQVSRHWPGSIRILLTGHADMNATVAAINRGQIFRYLNKPWSDEELRATVNQGLDLLALELEKQRLEALTRQQNAQLHDANVLLEQRVEERTAELNHAHQKLKRSYLTSIKVFSGLLELREGRLAGHGRRGRVCAGGDDGQVPLAPLFPRLSKRRPARRLEHVFGFGCQAVQGE